MLSLPWPGSRVIVAGQSIQPPDGLLQLVEARPLEIGTAHAAEEKGIPRKDAVAQHIAQAAWGVAGGLQHVKTQSGELQRLPAKEQFIRGRTYYRAGSTIWPPWFFFSCMRACTLGSSMS